MNRIAEFSNFQTLNVKAGSLRSSSGATLLRTALPIAIRSTSFNASRSILANIFVARRLANFARQQYKKWESGKVEKWKSSTSHFSTVQLFHFSTRAKRGRARRFARDQARSLKGCSFNCHVMRRSVENVALPFRALDGRLERFRVACVFVTGARATPPRGGGCRGWRRREAKPQASAKAAATNAAIAHRAMPVRSVRG